jgi:GR25 family glycosyltransferase involved in LPS biosynthesis
MIYTKTTGYILQHNVHKTFYVASHKSDTTQPIGGLRFDKFDSAQHYIYNSGLEEIYSVVKLTVTTEIESTNRDTSNDNIYGD